MLGEVQAAQGKIVLFIDEIHLVLGRRPPPADGRVRAHA